MTPEISDEEQAALTDFHFQCITQWAPCLDRAEILPKAEEEFRAGLHLNPRTGDRSYSAQCPATPELPARVNEDVLVGDVVHAELLPKKDEERLRDKVTFWKVTVRLDSVLKGRAPAIDGGLVSLEAPLWVASRAEGRGVNRFPDRVILAGSTSGIFGEKEVFTVWDCGTYEAAASNLAAAQRGAAEDFSPR